MKTALYTVFLLVLTAFGSIAQPSDLSVFSVGHAGWLSKHRPVMEHVPQEHVYGFELGVKRRLNGRNYQGKARDFHHAYGHPDFGLSFIYTGTGNKELMGQAYGLIGSGFMKLHQSERFQLVFRMGAGLGWVEKTFDRLENHKSIAIGSHLNMMGRFGLHGNYSLGKVNVFAGLGLTHFSNGSFRTPNLGINVFAAHAGLSYQLTDDQSRTSAQLLDPQAFHQQPLRHDSSDAEPMFL